MKTLITTQKKISKIAALCFFITMLSSCGALVNRANSDERWIYIMYIRHSSKNIAVSCLNTFDNRISSLSIEQQQRLPEFKNFSAFGCTGEIHTEIGFIPQVTDKLNIVVNDIELNEGESIEDFNGFTISAESNSLVVSSRKREFRLSENHDWSGILMLGSFDYAGIQKGQKYRYQKWCLSPLAPFSDDFEIYSIYIPKHDVAWFRRKIWYTSSSKSPCSNEKMHVNQQS